MNELGRRMARRGALAGWIATMAFGVVPWAGCSSGGGGDDTTQERRTGVFGSVRTLADAPIAGATVRVAGRATVTDATGAWRLAASVGEVVVQVEAEGYAPGFARVTVVDDVPTAAHVQLLAAGGPYPLDAEAGGTVEGARGAGISVPAGGLVDASGTVISGMVDVFLTPLDPADAAQLAAAPELVADLGASQVALESFGMMDITIRQSGQALQLAEGSTMEIRIPLPTGTTDPPETMPLWSFDEDRALWVNEGTLALDAEAGVYTGTISHMSWWNADIESETTCVCGSVVDADGNSVGGAAVRASGLDYLGQTQTTADAGGRFCIAARVNSNVRITAIHAAGGGQLRELRTSGTTSSVPPRNPSVCTDGGIWTIEPGDVTFPDGSSRSCADVLPQLNRCVGPVFADLSSCFQTAGSCENAGIGLFDQTTTWANGARTTTSIDLDAGQFAIEYFAASGQSCGRQVTNTSGEDSGQVRFEMPGGRVTEYRITNTPGGDATIGCQDGTTLRLTALEMESLQSCGGVGDDTACTDDATGGGVGEPCDLPADCPGTLICCGGQFCSTEALCPFGSTCGSNADCAGAEICCASNVIIGGSECTTPEVCARLTGCTDDAQCGDGWSCCDDRCREVEFCGGCGTDTDCDADSGGFCCNAGGEDAYCTTSALCFGGNTCTADADCGSNNDLLCCDRDGDSTCSTASSCYGNQPCTGNADCGPFACCTQEASIYANTCQETPAYCSFFQPCSGNADCFGGGTCCPSGQFADMCAPTVDACYLASACTQDADCGTSGNLTCCTAFGGVCLETASCSF